MQQGCGAEIGGRVYNEVMVPDEPCDLPVTFIPSPKVGDWSLDPV